MTATRPGVVGGVAVAASLAASLGGTAALWLALGMLASLAVIGSP